MPNLHFMNVEFTLRTKRRRRIHIIRLPINLRPSLPIEGAFFRVAGEQILPHFRSDTFQKVPGLSHHTEVPQQRVLLLHEQIKAIHHVDEQQRDGREVEVEGHIMPRRKRHRQQQHQQDIDRPRGLMQVNFEC